MPTIEMKLAKRRKEGNFRTLHLFEDLVDFSSCDYLGLARSERLAERTLYEWESARCSRGYRMGASGSRLLTGNSRYCEELESRIAAFHGHSAGLLYHCGYMANIGLISTVAGREDALFFDAHIHASMRDGIRMSEARAYPFRHQSLEHLEERLKRCTVKGNRYVLVESIYSTNGSLTPLNEILALCQEYDARLIVDEAHAVGAAGPQGQGVAAALGLASRCFALVVTFGKALGVHGAIVLGSETLKEALLNFSKPAIYTIAMPYYSLAAIAAAYALFPSLEKERRHLCRLVEYAREITLSSSSTHIQPVTIRGSAAAKKASRYLSHKGYDVRALTSPTVRQGSEVLRVCLHAFNTEEELQAIGKIFSTIKENHA